MINLQFVFKIDVTRIVKQQKGQKGKKTKKKGEKKLNLNFNWRSLSVIPAREKNIRRRGEKNYLNFVAFPNSISPAFLFCDFLLNFSFSSIEWCENNGRVCLVLE